MDYQEIYDNLADAMKMRAQETFEADQKEKDFGWKITETPDLVAEKLPFKFDIERIREYFNRVVKPLQTIWQSKQFGGWSILSANGDYTDGFQQGHKYFRKDEETGKTIFDYERAHREVGFEYPSKHINLTQVGTEYIAEVIQKIKDYQLKPHRARWTVITAGGETSWHRDGLEKDYSIRLHIPVISNPGAAFINDYGGLHMIDDGSCYVVAVNKMHKAVNLGNEDRIHIIMDVIDEIGISKHHQLAQHRNNYLVIS